MFPNTYLDYSCVIKMKIEQRILVFKKKFYLKLKNNLTVRCVSRGGGIEGCPPPPPQFPGQMPVPRI